MNWHLSQYGHWSRTWGAAKHFSHSGLIILSTGVMDCSILTTNRSLSDMERYAYCNLLVIAITCWVSFLGFRDPAFEERYLFWPEAILAWRQSYRLVTNGFLHLDLPHLVMNMVSLYFFGPLIERVFGPTQFLTIYLAAIIGGSLLALYVHRYHDYRALGASGGVAGIIFAYIFLFPGGSINIYFLPIGIPSWLYAIIYLAGSFYAMQRGMSNVGHDAHLGGALVGLFTAASFHPSAVRYHPWWFAGITTGSILLFIYMARNPLFLPLEGVDFTKAKARPAKRSARFSIRSVFSFLRKSRAAPRLSSRPEQEADTILRKISESGFDSLTEEEKKMLKEISNKYRRRAQRENPKSGFPF
jgi:membrane associated rhomboid family serine protease